MADQDTKTDELMTVEEAAAYLKVTPKTVYRWIAKNLFPAAKLSGTVWRIRRSALDRWVEQRSQSGAAEDQLAMRRQALADLRELRERIAARNGGPFPAGYGAELIREGRR